MPKFIPGLKLCDLFYRKEIGPILRKEFPRLRYSAALIGWGSEVLGFDTPMSRDHHWGPRLLLFLTHQDCVRVETKIIQTLSDKLPYEFLGYSTNYGEPEPGGVRHLVKTDHGPVNHMVQIFTLKSFFEGRLGFDPSQKISVIDWLTVPQQKLLEAVSGEVYHDGLGKLRKIREKLKFYPRDVWLFLLAAQWIRIAEVEAFVGRAGDMGDELGSSLIAAHQVNDIMKLAFLMEKQYAPYAKWFGTAFGKLRIGPTLTPVLRAVLLAKTWKAREKQLAEAYSIIAGQHNALRITRPLPTEATKYFGRPYLVLQSHSFVSSIVEAIKDPQVRSLQTIGSVDQLIDSHELLQRLSVLRRVRVLYEPPH
jgi:hypothetical protein